MPRTSDVVMPGSTQSKQCIAVQMKDERLENSTLSPKDLQTVRVVELLESSTRPPRATISPP
jgi:hypothetical protein